MIEITLDRDEWKFSASAGAMRQVTGIMDGRTPWPPQGNNQLFNGWFYHCNGASAEFAVCKWLGVEWNPTIGRIDCPDIDPLEVRSSNKADYPLMVRPQDPSESVFVHVTGIGPTYSIRGFILGQRAKQDHWLTSRPPPANVDLGEKAYYVGNRFLNHDLDALKERFLARRQRMAEDPA